MIKCLAGSLKAALSVALIAGAGYVFADDNVASLVGGDTTSGDQATVALDATIPTAFSYVRQVSGAATATAYFNAHVFCAETPRSPNQLSLQPRYQQSALLGNDVWRFPDVYAHSFVYQGSGAGNVGAPALVIGQGTSLVNKQFRCLSSQPNDSLEMPNVSHGLFDSGFGNDSTPIEPSGPHQNVTVSAVVDPGHSGLSVSVVKVETHFYLPNPADVTWTLVDGFNTSALSAVTDATWCDLGASNIVPGDLCASMSPQTGMFVRQSVSASAALAVSGSTTNYVLVYRQIGAGSATGGTPIQGFAALRTGDGMVGVAEESQDWFTDDSVWYNY